MNIRESKEKEEYTRLSQYAQKSAESVGRQYKIPECEIRTCFERDRDRIIHSKSFRRLKHKTQVFLAPEGDHYRTRLTHTIEVSQIARVIARALKMNEDLTEAIALGHDLGHTPFGHLGEAVLDDIMPGGFDHATQSLRTVEKLEPLNLTYEVRDGIANHNGGKIQSTPEAKIVHLSDRTAYINHDLDDALRSGILTFDKVPSSVTDILGPTSPKRVDCIVKDIINTSFGSPEIKMSDRIFDITNKLRTFLFENVYYSSESKLAEDSKAKDIIYRLFEYYVKHSHLMPQQYMQIAQSEGINRAVCDYIAGMTDRYAIGKYIEIFIPNSWEAN
ncbi:MAG: deoxyguanosinetriphosphate triphosphohydrolase [Eubacteriaceae bacterium]